MIPNYKRPTFREYLYNRLEEPLTDEDLDMIEYIEGLEKEKKMVTYVKLEEFTKEDLIRQLEEGKIDIDFLLDYIVKIDEVYNKLIDRANTLEDRKDKAEDYLYCIGEAIEPEYQQELLKILNGGNDEDN